MKYERTAYADGGLASEAKDCSIRAVSVAACIDYSEAYRLFAVAGRKPKKSTQLHITSAVLGQLFPGVSYHTTFWGWEKNLNLARFIREHSTGHYVVHVSQHLIAICDGVVHDWNPKQYRRVFGYWQLC